GLMHVLRHGGHIVNCVGDGNVADTTLKMHDFDVVILDRGLPGCDGIRVLSNMRARDDHTPVLMLTARDELEDRVQGLDAGADDYIVKPFETAELEARMRA